MNNYIRYFAVVSLFMLLWSCYEDKGNYVYDLQEKVAISGMDSTHSVFLRHNLTVDPKIKDSDQYSFLWTIFESSNAYAPIDTLSTSPVLSEVIKLIPGQYYLQLQLTDKSTGYTQFARTTVFVTTEFATGWYVLKTNETTSDLDIFMPQGTRQDNVIAVMNDAPMQGKATSMVYYPEYKIYSDVYRTIGIITDKDMSMFNTSDLTTLRNRQQLFYSEPDLTETPCNFLFTTLFNMFFSDKKVYSISKSGPGANKYGDYFQLDGQIIEPTLYMQARDRTLIYDKKGKRFVNVYWGSVSPYKKEMSAGVFNTDLPDPNALDCFPVYVASMGMNKTDYGKTGYILMKHEVKNERYLYEMNSSDIASGKTFNPVKRVIPIPAGLKINDARLFGHNYELFYLYYSVGNTIYLYDTQTQTESPMMPGIEGEVTMIKNIYWQKASDETFNYLVIATYNNGKYKVSIYNMLGGRPTGEPQVMTGEGKAVSVQYVTSKMESTDVQYYPFH